MNDAAGRDGEGAGAGGLARKRRGGGRRERKPPRPLEPQSLRDLGLAYMARYATSAAKVEAYLARKLRERGWSEDADAPPDLPAMVARWAEMGYVDDAAYARMKADGMLARGLGERRIGQALWQAGIDEPLREDVAPDEPAAREAALRYARRRRLGPFARDRSDDPKRREKAIAAMLRAGHGFDAARAMLDARNEAEAEEWVAEAIE